MKVFGLRVNCIFCSLDFRYTEAVVRRFFSEQTLLKISQCWSFSLIKLQAFRHAILLKRNFNIGAFLFCEICKIFKSIFFTEHLRWLLLELSYELSLYCIMRMMNRVIMWYVLALQRLFHFIVCVSFISISFSFINFFCGFYYLLRHWSKFVNTSNKAWELFLEVEFRGVTGWVASALLSIINVANWLGSVSGEIELHLTTSTCLFRITCCRVSLWN